jgi:peptide deformylase
VSADDPEEDPSPFSAALTAWRERRALAKKKLAVMMGFSASYLSHVEAGRMHASELFARKAEEALDAGGELAEAWRRDPASVGDGSQPPPGGLFVEEDHAELSYDGAFFRASQRRVLRNGGPDPVTRYLMRISVDRYPGQPERSNALYRARPLTWGQVGLTASCDGEPLTWGQVGLTASCDGEPMTWKVKADRDAFKEAWLCFENDRGRFPLYPGQAATVSYSYTVDDRRWGPWFQRAVRLPTRRLSVSLVFPAALDPVVWGTETSATAAAIPLRTAPARAARSGHAVFSWATSDPPVGTRYRLEWRFRARPDDSREHPELRTAADRMKAAGIVQDGDPVLLRQAVPFRLPEEAAEAEAEAVIAGLFAALQRAGEQHVFSKGMGVAAPQAGIGRAAAIVMPPEPGAEPVVMLNPVIISESAEEDEQYEGCLSFFDVRGIVPRPLRIEVACTRPDGQQYILALDNAMARLVAHEVDHLNGRLYTSRMREGTSPIPVAEYRGTGHAWAYPAPGRAAEGRAVP